MRLSLWLVLILAFSVGMGCAIVIRHFHFEAKPVAVQTAEPTMKILVATRTIPAGVEITADFVAFQEVPLSEVPLGTLSHFAQVYRRQPAFPIPTGCPICEDLLLPYVETASQATFIPTGSQFVTLDIVHIRQGNQLFSLKEPLSSVLAADQRIDVRIVPRNAVQGRLAEMKNEVLSTFAARDVRNSGELILENVPIHQIQRRAIGDHTGSVADALVLLLSRNEAARLAAATRRGQVRILVHQSEEALPQPVNIGNVVDVAEQPKPQPDVLSGIAPLDISPPDIPLALEQPLPVLMEATPVFLTENVQRAAPIPANIFESMLHSVSVPASDFATSSFVRLPQSSDRQSSKPSDNSEKVLVRNDPSVVSFGTTPQNTASERAVEQNRVEQNTTERNIARQNTAETNTAEPPMLPTGALSMAEPGQEALARPYSETVLGTPRVTQAIQFLSPGSVSLSRERPQTMARRDETSPVTVIPPPAPIIPSVLPPPLVTLGTPGLPDYSPFERRIYTVLPSEESSDHLGMGVPTPPRLLKNSDAGTNTK
jgi:Flp pilus assembly protein CpaB